MLSDSYIAMNARYVKSLAEQSLKEIAAAFDDLLNHRISRRRTKHDKWRWLPWWKPWDDTRVKLQLVEEGRYPWTDWHRQSRCEALLQLAEFAPALGDIYVSAEDVKAMMNR